MEVELRFETAALMVMIGVMRSFEPVVGTMAAYVDAVGAGESG